MLDRARGGCIPRLRPRLTHVLKRWKLLTIRFETVPNLSDQTFISILAYYAMPLRNWVAHKGLVDPIDSRTELDAAATCAGHIRNSFRSERYAATYPEQIRTRVTHIWVR